MKMLKLIDEKSGEVLAECAASMEMYNVAMRLGGLDSLIETSTGAKFYVSDWFGLNV